MEGGEEMMDKELAVKARVGLSALRKAIREEMTRKAKLGQYAIVSRNGKAVRVLASELIKSSGRKKIK